MSFGVALSGSFLRPDGSPAYPDFDLSPLIDDPAIELTQLAPGPVIQPEQVAGLDALILLGEDFRRDSIAPTGGCHRPAGRDHRPPRHPRHGPRVRCCPRPPAML